MELRRVFSFACRSRCWCVCFDDTGAVWLEVPETQPAFGFNGRQMHPSHTANCHRLGENGNVPISLPRMESQFSAEYLKKSLK